MGAFSPRTGPIGLKGPVTIKSVQLHSKKENDLNQSTTLAVQFTGNQGLEQQDTELEVSQVGTDGHWQIPLQIIDKKCNSNTCTYQAITSLESNKSKTFDFDLNMRVVVNGLGSVPFHLPEQRYTIEPFEHSHRIHGTIDLRYVRREPDLVNSENNPDYPQYATVRESVRSATVKNAVVVLQDNCGHYILGATDSRGHYSFEWTPAGCSIGSITVWTVTKKGQRNKVGVGSWRGRPLDDMSDLTDRTQDYLAYSFIHHFFIPNADTDGTVFNFTQDIVIPQSNHASKAFFIYDNMLTALAYFNDINGVLNLPKINVEYTSGLKPESIHFASWDGQSAMYLLAHNLIHIPSVPPNADYGWNRFAHLHEASHFFQRHFLRTHTYGKIGEPLANVQALAIMGNSWFDKQFGVFENMDVQANFEDGRFRQADWAFCNTSACMLDYSYGWVQRVLWDLVDPVSEFQSEPLIHYVPEGGTSNTQFFGQFDLVNGGGGHGLSVDPDDHVLNDVLMNYLGGGLLGERSPDYVDRGLPTVDIVDVLDGMRCRGHATLHELERIVNHAMGFDYTVDGTVGDCN